MERASGFWRASALFLFVGCAAACAAPDAVPGAPGTVGPYQPTPGEGGDPLWGEVFGQAAGGIQRGYDIAIDRTTNTAVATLGFDSGIEIPGVDGTPFTTTGALDLVVVQLSANTGTPTWAKRFGAYGETTRTVVDIDFQGNVIIAGGFDDVFDIGLGPVNTVGGRDVFVAKLDPTGNPLWLRTFGEVSSQFATDVATDGEGNVIVVGYTEGPAYEFGPGVNVKDASASDLFITKLSPSGATLWGERVGMAATGEPNDPTACVAVSRTDGSILVGGAYADALVFPGNVQLPILGKQDGFVVKLDTYGSSLWGKSFGVVEREQRVKSVAFGVSGEALFTGGYEGDLKLGEMTLSGSANDKNMLVGKLNAAGEHVFGGGYGAGGDQIGRQIAADSEGNLMVVGDFEGVLELFGQTALVNADVDGYWDIVAAKFGAKDGAPIWGKKYGDFWNQHVGGAVLEANDDVLIVGTNEGKLMLGNPIGAVETTGGEDAFVMAISP
jgi:hypothetical protein